MAPKTSHGPPPPPSRKGKEAASSSRRLRRKTTTRPVVEEESSEGEPMNVDDVARVGDEEVPETVMLSERERVIVKRRA